MRGGGLCREIPMRMLWSDSGGWIASGSWKFTGNRPPHPRHRLALPRGRAQKSPCSLKRCQLKIPVSASGSQHTIFSTHAFKIVGEIHRPAPKNFVLILIEVKSVIAAWRREGDRPRGSHISDDFRHELNGGKVTIAVAVFPMNNWLKNGFIPDREPLSIWIEEMKIPTLVASAE